MAVIARNVDRSVLRLGAVEADEAVVEAPVSVKGLRRVARRAAASLRRRLRAQRRGVARIPGHEAVAPRHAAVGRAVVAGPLVARAAADLRAVVVRPGGDHVARPGIHRHAGLVLATPAGAATLHRRVRAAVISRVGARRGVIRDKPVRARGRHDDQQAQKGEHGGKTAARHESPLASTDTSATAVDAIKHGSALPLCRSRHRFPAGRRRASRAVTSRAISPAA